MTDPTGSTDTTDPNSKAVTSKRPTAPSTTVTVESSISAAEAADRRAIEDVWMDYWDVIYRMQEIPKKKRRAVYGEVMVDPELQNVLDSAALNDKEGWANYGTVTHDIHWGPPVNGKNEAVMKDCQNQSKFGAYDTKTKKALTRGHRRVNVNATFKRVTGGWRVAGVFAPAGTSC